MWLFIPNESYVFAEKDVLGYCGSCDKEFDLAVYVSVEYSTRKKEEVRK